MTYRCWKYKQLNRPSRRCLPHYRVMRKKTIQNCTQGFKISYDDPRIMHNLGTRFGLSSRKHWAVTHLDTFERLITLPISKIVFLDYNTTSLLSHCDALKRSSLCSDGPETRRKTCSSPRFRSPKFQPSVHNRAVFLTDLLLAKIT